MKSLLTMICENFLSETRAGSNDMPLQLQFDFRFRRALKEHLKQMCRTKFCYYTNAKSHYPRVKSDLGVDDLIFDGGVVQIRKKISSICFWLKKKFLAEFLRRKKKSSSLNLGVAKDFV